MKEFKLELFQSDRPLLRHTAFLRRENILWIWHGSSELIQQFLFLLNSFYSPIEFTVEVGGKKINFTLLQDTSASMAWCRASASEAVDIDL